MLRFRYSGNNNFIITSAILLLFSLIAFAGCVPTPSQNADVSPEITDLRTVFYPQLNKQIYLWYMQRNAAPGVPADSGYYFENIDSSSKKAPDGYSPLWQVNLSDSLQINSSVVNEAYISDSLILLYYTGNSIDSATPKLKLLEGILQVGETWIAADNFKTTNGAKVQIAARVINYYGQISVAGKTYNDVYLVIYTSHVNNGSQVPSEPEYQEGSHIDRYYAKDIGEILEVYVNASGSQIQTNELTETRKR